jgi:hypothetical protein
VELLEGALILLAGILVGRSLPARRVPKLPKPPDPICGCTHHYSYHDPENGLKCNVGIFVNGKPRGACACVRYTGPEPLPLYFAP